MGKTSPSSQGCAPALAGQPKSPAVRWSRLCTPCLLPAFPSLLLPHRVILQAAAAARRAPSPALTLACFYFPPSVVLLCRQQRGQRPHEPSSAWRCPAAGPATEATAHTQPTSEPSPSRAVGVSPKGGDTRRGSVPSASRRRGATPGLERAFHRHLVPPPWHRQEREALWGQNTRCWRPAEGCPSSFLSVAHHPRAEAA